MKDVMETELYKATALTFDELGFMYAMPELADDTEDAIFEAQANVEFSGPFSGNLSVVVRGDILSPLASNMLGEDSPPSKYQQLDALGEIANVICGNVLPNIGSPKDVFRIGAPQVTETESACAEGVSSRTALVRLPLGQGRADVFLSINEMAA